MRFLKAGATLSTIAIGVFAAAPAFAAPTGGTSAGSEAATKQRIAARHSAAAPATATSPVTAKSSSLKYRGPVYERTATGEIVPYVPALSNDNLQKGMTGGSPVGVTADTKPQLLVPGSLARWIGGYAAAPMAAPLAIQQVIWAGNQIVGLPYIYGGGHASFLSRGYDCSGTVSFALHGASLLSTPADSSEFMSWGSHGVGRWITIFSNPGHAYMTVAGLRLDTSAADDPSSQQGPRWRPLRHANSGYKIRHPLGL